MLRQITGVMLALGVVLASVSVGTSAFADTPKDQSSSPREKIYDLKDGRHVHIITMSGGRYLMSITHTNGKREVFIINPRTGQVTPGAHGNVYWGAARMLVKNAAVLAMVKPFIEEMRKPALAVSTNSGTTSVANKPTTAPALIPAVTAERPPKPAVSTTVSTTVGGPLVTTKPVTAPALVPAVTAVRPPKPAVSTTISTTVGAVSIKTGPTTASAVRTPTPVVRTMVNTTVGAPRISMAPAIAVRVPTVTPVIRR